MNRPTLSEFQTLAQHGNLIPVYRELAADLETPVSVFLKLRGNGESCLLESVEGGERLARYSFLATDPPRVLTLCGDQITIRNHAHTETFSLNGRDPLCAMREFLAPRGARAVAPPGLPRFFGGAIGYLAYDLARHIEHLPRPRRSSACSFIPKVC